MVWFTLKGKLIKEVKKSPWITLIPVKNNYVKWKINFDQKKRKVDAQITLLNEKKKKIKDLYLSEFDAISISIASDTGKETKKMIPHYLGVFSDKNNIYIADSKKGFYIQILDSNGENIDTINLDIEDIPVSSDHKKKAIDKLKKSRNWNRIKDNNFFFYKFFPKIKSFLIEDDKIIAATHKVKDNKNEFIILNKKGKIIKKIFLPIKDVKYTFSKNKYYYLKENETTESWELFSIELFNKLKK